VTDLRTPDSATVTDLDPLPLGTDLVLGIVAGIWGIATSLLGEYLQLDNKILAQVFLISSPRISDALLLASLLETLWERRWALVRHRWLRNRHLILLPTSTSHLTASLLNRCGHLFKLMVLLSSTLTGLAWILVFLLCSLISKLILLLKNQVVMDSKAGFRLLSLLLDILGGLMIRLWRRPIWRRRSHDAPCLELQRLRREPTQFNNGAPFPPPRID